MVRLKEHVRRMLYGAPGFEPIGQWVEVIHYTDEARMKYETFVTKTYLSNTFDERVSDLTTEPLPQLKEDEKLAVFLPEDNISLAGGDVVCRIDKHNSRTKPTNYKRITGNNASYQIEVPVIAIHEACGDIAYYLCRVKEYSIQEYK